MSVCMKCTEQRNQEERIRRQESTQPSSIGTVSIGGAIAFAILAIVLCASGIYRMYSYGYDDRIVGGDAYNYLIITNRGIGLICGSIVLMLISCALLLLAIASRLQTSANDGKLKGNSKAEETEKAIRVQHVS